MKNKEHQEQKQLFYLLQLEGSIYPALRYIYAIPNGGRRDIITAAKLKAEGVKSGVPDVFVPVPSGEYHGMFIEMKVGNNKQTENQKRYFDFLGKQGYKCVVCYSAIEAFNSIAEYLKIERRIK